MVALVEDQEIEFVFNKYAENGLMGRYGLKCSIIYLYGDDIKNVINFVYFYFTMTVELVKSY
jgi:hypothetical protein